MTDPPCIVTCSISGAVANREQCPAIPYTPEEYAAEAKRAVDEGASMIHIHARTPDGVPSYEVADFRAITEAIQGAVEDVIVNYSTGAIGIPIQKRIEYLRELRPDVAALNMGSMNYAKYSSKRKDFVFKTVFENSFDTIIEFVTAMNELGHSTRTEPSRRQGRRRRRRRIAPAVKQRRQRPGVESQSLPELLDRHRLTLPEHHHRQILRIGQAELAQRSPVDTVHRPRRGVQIEAELILQQHCHGGSIPKLTASN